MTAISHVRLAMPDPQELDRWLDEAGAGPMPGWLSVEAGPEPRIAWWAVGGRESATAEGGLLPRAMAADGGTARGVVLATVDLDRAESDLEASIGSGWADAAADPVLGARCRRLELDDGVIVLAEPTTEGYAAACLARFGEGPIAVALHGRASAGRTVADNPVAGGSAAYLRMGVRTAPTLIVLAPA